MKHLLCIFATWLLSVAMYAENVTLTLYAKDCGTPNIITCPKGQQVRITAEARLDETRFVRWSDGNTDNPRTITMNSNLTLTAEYDIPPTYTIQLFSEGCENANVFLCKEGCQLSLSAYSLEGYQFMDWSDGNMDNPRLITVTGDATYTARYYNSHSHFGKCGDNLYWQYDNGALTISGTGNMYDNPSSFRGYWLLFRDSITTISVPSGCTHIGDSAFFGLTNKQMKTITLPNSVETIGKYAFANCDYLKTVTLGASTNDIANYAFANDERLLYVNCYAMEPPLLQEDAFANYDVYLNVPCEVKDEYKVAKGWKLFNKDNVSCIAAEPTTATTDVKVEPSTNEAVFTWPTSDNASSYNIAITKDDELFCTLVFNANGQLTGIAFAPGRDGEHNAPAAVLTANGFRFTVTGLNEGTHYAYSLDVKNASGKEIKSYTGEFDTKGGTTALEETLSGNDQGGATKFIKDGILYILRDGKIYNAQGLSIGEDDR